MNHPERRTQQRDVFHEYALAAVEVHQLRTKSVIGAEGALLCPLPFVVLHWHTILATTQQSRTCLNPLTDTAFLVTEVWYAAPCPPSVVAGAAIDGSLAGDGDVGLLEGVDAG